MNKLLVFGHQNPDTDAITSAIAYAYYLNHNGTEAEAVALGLPSEETIYALNQLDRRPTCHRDCCKRNGYGRFGRS